MSDRIGISGKIAHAFIQSKLTPLIVIASLLLGLFAVIVTPREEEPQIVVPMIDVYRDLPRRLGQGGRGAGHPPHGEAPLGDQGRRVHLLHREAGVQPDHRPVLRGREHGGQPRQALQQAHVQLRPDPARRLPADGQGQVHRRRAHPHAHPLERKPPHLGLRTAAGGPRALHGDQEGPECRRVHRHRRPAPPGEGRPRPGKAQGLQRLRLPDHGRPGQVERFAAVGRLPLAKPRDPRRHGGPAEQHRRGGPRRRGRL